MFAKCQSKLECCFKWLFNCFCNFFLFREIQLSGLIGLPVFSSIFCFFVIFDISWCMCLFFREIKIGLELKSVVKMANREVWWASVKRSSIDEKQHFLNQKETLKVRYLIWKLNLSIGFMAVAIFLLFLLHQPSLKKKKKSLTIRFLVLLTECWLYHRSDRRSVREVRASWGSARQEQLYAGHGSREEGRG